MLLILLRELNLGITGFELEQKLHALVKSDIINQGRSNFYYQGVRDNIFDKVFWGMFADDIKEFDSQESTVLTVLTFFKFTQNTSEFVRLKYLTGLTLSKSSLR